MTGRLASPSTIDSGDLWLEARGQVRGGGGGLRRCAANAWAQPGLKWRSVLPALQHQGGVGAAKVKAVSHDGIQLHVFAGFAQYRHIGQFGF